MSNTSSRAQFRADENGATAVEFALIAPLLFLSIFSLIEIGALGMMVSGFDHAVTESARRIRTGRDDGATSAAGFEDQICGRLGGDLVKCKNRLVVNVQRYNRFADGNAAVAAAPTGQFNKGAAGDIIVVKADYRWPLMTPFIATSFNRDGPLDITIASRAAFKNEPFD